MFLGELSFTSNLYIKDGFVCACARLHALTPAFPEVEDMHDDLSYHVGCQHLVFGVSV